MKKLTILGSVLAILFATAMSPGGEKSAVTARLSLELPAGTRAPVNISNSAPESSQPLVGVDAAGSAYAVWYEHLSPRTFFFSTNKSGIWSAPGKIESLNWDTGESGWPIWAVAPNGAAHLTFFDAKMTASDGLLTYDVFDRAYENGTWGPTTDVSTNNVQNASIYPGMAINPVDNYTYLVWSDHNGTPDRSIKSRYRKADGTWVPTPFPPVGSTDAVLPVGFGDMPRIAIDGQGTAHMVWGYIHGRTIWYSKNRTPQNKSGWTSPLRIKWDAGNEWSGPNVAADNAGSAYIYWTDGPADFDNPTAPGNDAEIALCKVDSGGTPGAVINISQSPGIHSYDPSLAVNPVAGDIVVAWTENGNIMGNVCVGGRWSGPVNITNNAAGAESRTPGVAADKSGGAYLVYSHKAAASANWDIMFLAVSQPTAARLSVTAPNGGEIWYIGSSHAATWTTTGTIGNVKIEYSTNGGSSYATLVSSTPNTGSYAWTVPNAPSTNCLVKVSDASNAAVADVSDAAFVIMAPPVALAVTTTAISSLTTTSLLTGGNVTSDGGAVVTDRGVCVSTSANPTLVNGHTHDGSGTGSFTSSLTSATPGTTYHVRAYATNSAGTAYGNDVWFRMLGGTKSDFNGDGQEDLLWRNFSTGENYIWYLGYTATGMAGFQTVDSQVMFQSPDSAKISGEADIPLSGKAVPIYRSIREGARPGKSFRTPREGLEALGYEQSTLTFSRPFGGQMTTFGLTRSGGASAPPLTDFNWKIAGTGDLNGDGKTDILLSNVVTGEIGVWYMNGGTRIGAEYLPTMTDLNWQIVGTGDFNGDAKLDIVWRNSATGENGIWYMSGATRIGAEYLLTVTDMTWQIVGTGDFNGDGKIDILWRNAVSGENYIWCMDGVNRIGGIQPPSVTDKTWQIVATGDYNQDGKFDIVWRNIVSGENAVWYMNGATRIGLEFLSTVADLNWKIVNR